METVTMLAFGAWIIALLGGLSALLFRKSRMG
jgi:hypothetical protein